MAQDVLTLELDDGITMQVLVDDSPGPVLVADSALEGGLDTVTRSIEKVGREVGAVLQAIAPTKATVELGFNVSVEAGRLVAMLVGKGTGSASIKVTLEWSRET